MRPLFLLSWIALGCGCLHAEEAPKLRLGDAVRPTHYKVELTLDPGKDTFSGVADIDVEVRAPRETIWINAVALEIREASIGGRAAKTVPGNEQVIGLATGGLTPAGRTRLHVAYTGRISRHSSAGIFQLAEENRWYVFTQFEPTDARRAFPCFDEPEYKTPWEISLRVPKDMVAVSNAPEAAESDAGDGTKVVRFATTRPLPSYLVAFGVGPFDTVDLGRAGRSRTPMRLIVPRGKGDETQFAAEALPQLFARLEEYFGIPYGYAKLDSLVMPVANFAMENVGLITYSESLLLSKPARDSVPRRRSCALVAAHEMAHQWFGDLVTTAWWDDIWLNEAFATWMEGKITAEWKPEWNVAAGEVNDALGAMNIDSLVTTRRIRQPIASDNDIANAFDTITYEKGAAVIRMFENWLGAAKFREGVRAYLRENTDRSATAAQFLAALSKAAGRDVAPAFSTFLDQAGVPVVSMELECGGGAPRLEVSQKRYLPIGSRGDAAERWQVPLCVKYEAGGAERSQCELLADPRSRVTLDGAATCPAWVMGNDGAKGYYRVAYGRATLERLLAGGMERLSLAEKVDLLGDVRALVNSGDMPAGEALALVPKLAGAAEREVVDAVREIAALAVGPAVPDDLLEKGRAFIRDAFGDRAERLGWQPRAGEPEDTRLLRQSLVRFVAGEGRDQKLIDEAERLARAWLRDRSAIDPGMAGAVVVTAARFGDRPLFDALVEALAGEKERRWRQTMLRALSSFKDPALARAGMQLFLTGNYDARESFYALLFGPLENRGTRTLPFEFVEQNLAAILARLPREVGADFAAVLPSLGGGFCNAAGRARVERFFGDRVKEYTGGPRQLAQVLESIGNCAARSAATGPSIAEYLGRYAPARGANPGRM